MAPIKFEEHIKEKLDKREIKPSVRAWESIASSIDNTNQGNKKGFVWYAIAACILGLLMASLFLFFGQKEALDVENSIVDKPTTEKPIEKLIKPAIIVEDAIIETTTKLVEREENPVSVEESLQPNKGADKSLDYVANLNDNEKLKTFDNIALSNEDLINNKIHELIAQVDSLEIKNKTSITDAEIDALLIKAQNEILEQRIFKQNNTVDAMALLNEAENELDKSFRDQLFNTLKNGFFKVRTAVADRNN